MFVSNYKLQAVIDQGWSARGRDMLDMQNSSALKAFMTLVVFVCLSLSVAVADPDFSKNHAVQLSDDETLSLIWVEPGSFMMGSPASEPGHNKDEAQHPVTLTSGYWLGRYEVTRAQWKALMGTTEKEVRAKGKEGSGDQTPGKVVHPQRPMRYTSWDDAMEFCSKLNMQEKAAGRLPENFEYTLPTEAQWEYACRAGSTTAIHTGEFTLSENWKLAPELDSIAWYFANSAMPEGVRGWSGTWTPKEDGRPIEVTIEQGGLQDVGGKRANPWGFHDMLGNAWELCFDRYGDYPATAVIDPIGPDSGDTRVKRGGSWAHPAASCRSANRSSAPQDFQIDVTGFRLALAPVQ